jgi:hypothetical protein
MMRVQSWLLLTLVFGGVLGLSRLALAQTGSSDSTEAVREPDRTVYERKTVIDFSEVTVEGELKKPEGSYLLDRGRSRFRSLLKLRANFVPELIRSTDQL